LFCGVLGLQGGLRVREDDFRHLSVPGLESTD
jgi:hypothetical protein